MPEFPNASQAASQPPPNQPSLSQMRRSGSGSSLQKDIEKEILGGLPNQIGRMRDAYDCLRYSQARFEEYPTRHKDQRYRSPSVRRTSPIFKRILEVLTMHLYKNQPTRKLPDKEASGWLEQVYRRNFLWAKMRRCDQLTLIGGFAAYQFSGSTDPAHPVDITLWGADQVAFWVHPDNPTEAIAVAVVDFWDNRRRLRLFTEDEIVTYDTDKGVVHPAFGTNSFRQLSRKANPYRDRQGKGLVPFAFAHWTFPSQDFETNSPGLNLKELNQGVNERLDNLGDSIYFNARPIGLAEGVDEAWTPPAEIRPGDFITLPASSVDAGGNGPRPTLSYLMPELAYVTTDWEDLNNNLDHQMEMWGVPPSLIRMVQTGARSGLAIQSEQLPILGWVEGRRSDWAAYEEGFARRAIEISEAHLRNVGMQAEADTLQRVLDEWSFTLRWPALYIQLPGPDRDRSDDRRLEKGLVSLVGVAQETMDLTEEEAFEYLAKVKAQKDRLIAMGIEKDPQLLDPYQQQIGGLGPPPLDPAENPEGQTGEQLVRDQQTAEQQDYLEDPN